MNRGLNTFKQKGEKSITEELEQLHRRDAFQKLRTENLSEKQKHVSLALLMLFKKKRGDQ